MTNYETNPLEVTPLDIVDAYYAKEIGEDTKAYKDVREFIERFIEDRYQYYNMDDLANMIGIPTPLLLSILGPQKVTQMGTKHSPPVVTVKYIT